MICTISQTHERTSGSPIENSTPATLFALCLTTQPIRLGASPHEQPTRVRHSTDPVRRSSSNSDAIASRTPCHAIPNKVYKADDEVDAIRSHQTTSIEQRPQQVKANLRFLRILVESREEGLLSKQPPKRRYSYYSNRTQLMPQEPIDNLVNIPYPF